MGRRSFEVGDLVACKYDLHHFLYYVFGADENNDVPIFHGVIIAKEEGTPYFEEYIYEVYCTDGQYRYFMEDEVFPISWLTFP